MKMLWVVLAAVVIAGCSDTPTKSASEQKKEEAKPLDPITGRQAYQQMYPAARAWAPDAQPLHVTSIRLSDVKADKGKSGAWLCLFVSPSRSRVKTYTWSAVEAEGNLHKGVFAGQEESYSPSRQMLPFLTAAIKVDSDEAYGTAIGKSEEYLKKNPNKPVNFVLEQTPRHPDLTWRIFWGETVGTSDYSVYVDATTGQFLERVH
jgi:hypothetical protein